MASTCSTWLVPMPNASAPKAPCVAVCESPQTMVMPGCVNPCSGPMTCTMPCRGLRNPKYGIPNSWQFFSNCSTCARATGSTIGSPRGVVGVEWSQVPKVRSGRRTRSPRLRRPSNACGEVTSCTRCRSI